MIMKLAILCDGCGRMYHNPAYTDIAQAEALRTEARAAGWVGDMNRLSVKDACPECKPPPPPPKLGQPGAVTQALRTLDYVEPKGKPGAALPPDETGGKAPSTPHERKPDFNEHGYDGHKESRS